MGHNIGGNSPPPSAGGSGQGGSVGLFLQAHQDPGGKPEVLLLATGLQENLRGQDGRVGWVMLGR